jgi:hypothetical protein
MRRAFEALVAASVALAPCGAFAAPRLLRFSQAFGSRCPSDRFFVAVYAVNNGTTAQRVRVDGFTRIDGGDGSCGQSYAGLTTPNPPGPPIPTPITLGQTAPFLPTGWVTIPAGKSVLFTSVMPHAGGLFSVYGTATVPQPNANVSIRGDVQILADDIGAIMMKAPLAFAAAP